MREGENGIPDPVDRRWLFGPVVLDERTLELEVQGRPVEIERKSLQVLIHLLNHAGEVVTKDELLAGVWPGRILSDSVITSCMTRLRDALGDETQSVIKTVHGYGYRLIAPVKVEAAAPAARPRFEFKPGEHLPARPLWSLIERLGTGGHGEAWLARHDKTHERRVYKFAADSDALVMLKREITIYRLLHDSLGDRPDFVHLLDWNLEDPPYFVEYDYQEAGSLTTWAKAQGGLDRVPPAVRLDIAAQVADALGAAHSVGVLHKDLKPSNVLIERREGQAPQIKLCDFGSGGVLDVGRLERMGITRLGFTKTIAHGTATGTPLYLAPEVIGGQPFTVRSDIYALGVLLYQLMVGNFHKPMAPGWELDVDDELLREDIALAAEGHPERRLADAARLAQRLRTLEDRRRQRAAEYAAKAEAESNRLEMERMRARRNWVRLAIAALVGGVTISSLLYLDARRARDEASAAAETTRAVSEFLSKDMLAAINVEERPLRDLSLKEVLDNAAQQIDARFAARPEIAAELHAALGGAYYSLTQTREAKTHLNRAISLFDQQRRPGSEAALESAAMMIELENSLGTLAEAMPGLEQLLARGAERLGPTHPRVLALRLNLAYGEYWSGRWRQSANLLRVLLADAARVQPRDEALLGRGEYLLGVNLAMSGDFAQAESLTRTALETLVTKLGPDHLTVASVRRSLGEILSQRGRFEEADAELSSALAIARGWVKDETGNVLSIRLTQARLRLEQGRDIEAIAILRDCMRALAGWRVEAKDQTMWFREGLALALQRQGQLAEAEKELTLAIRIGQKSLVTGHPELERFRIELADVLADAEKLDAAWALLQTVNRQALTELAPVHPYLGHLRRVEGRLWHAQRDFTRAREAWLDAQRIYQTAYGAGHARERWVAAALGRLPPVAQATR